MAVQQAVNQDHRVRAAASAEGLEEEVIAGHLHVVLVRVGWCRTDGAFRGKDVIPGVTGTRPHEDAFRRLVEADEAVKAQRFRRLSWQWMRWPGSTEVIWEVVISLGPRSDNRGYAHSGGRSLRRTGLQWVHGPITVVMATDAGPIDARRRSFNGSTVR